MPSRRALLLLCSMALFPLVIVAGWGVGTKLGKTQQHRRDAQSESARAESLLGQTLDIRIGGSFPDLVLSTPSGSESTQLSDLLPEGGAVLYVAPACGSCVRAALMFESWIRSHVADSVAGAIITDDLEATAAFARVLRDSLVNLPVYCDVTKSLRKNNLMTELSAFFVLSGNSLELEEAGVWAEKVGFTLSKEP